MQIYIARALAGVTYNPPFSMMMLPLEIVIVVVVVARLPDARLFFVCLFSARLLGGRLNAARGRTHLGSA